MKPHAPGPTELTPEDPTTLGTELRATAPLEVTSSTIPAPGLTIGPYKLLEKIGEGGFGEVWLAEQREPVKRRVALKIIKLGMDTRQVVARFEAERQALALMDHPNIAKVLDAGATELGRPYFVMEHVKGVPITDYCRTQKLDTTARLQLFIQICRAIQHAHQKGIIHRDIKPSNILVAIQDGAPIPKVIDFGIAKATQMELTEKTIHTQLNQFIGTPAYMSPEQAEMTSLDIDTRSDIYSLGVLLYELLTGTTPFDTRELLSAGLDEMRRIIREREPLRPSTRLSQIIAADAKPPGSTSPSASSPPKKSVLDSDLDWIVLKCLEKDRTRRYETANGLALDLQRHLEHEPVSARPPSTWYRCQKAWRRNRLACAAAAGLFLALSLAIVSVSVAAVRESTLRLRAEAARLESQRNLYAADMLLVQQAKAEGDLGQMRRLLARYSTHPPNTPDLRGWEWHHYWHETRSQEMFTLGGLTWPVGGIVFCGSDLIASLGADGTVELYSLASRTRVTARRLAEDRRLFSLDTVRFVGSPDGKLLAVGAKEAIFILGVPSLQVLARKDFPSEPLTVLALDSTPALLASRGHSLYRLALDNLSVLSATTLAVEPLAFLSSLAVDNRFAFFTSRLPSGSNYFQVWDLEMNIPMGSGDDFSVGRSGGTRFSPNGRWIVRTATHPNRTASVREMRSGREVKRFSGFQGWVIAAAWSPDSTQLALASADRRVHIYSTDTWEPLAILQGHLDEVSAIAYSPDSSLVVTGGKDGEIKVWSAKIFPASAPEFPISAATILSADGTIATENLTDSTRFTRLPEFQEFSRTTNPISAVALDGSLVASFEAPAKIVVRSVANGQIRSEIPHPSAEIQTIAFSEKPNLLAYSDAQYLYIWDANSPVPVGERALGWHGSPSFQYIAVSSGADRVAITYDTEIALFSLSDSRWRKDLSTHREGVTGLSFSSSGRLLASSSHDASVALWDVESGELIHQLRGQPFSFASVCFSRDGTRLAAGGVDGTIRLWDTVRWSQVAILTGQNAWVESLAFGPDDRYLATASRNLLKIFEAPRLRER